MGNSLTLVGILGAVIGTLTMLFLLIYFKGNRSTSGARGDAGAGDVALLVVGSFAGMIACESLL
jgi:hypothetical protein